MVIRIVDDACCPGDGHKKKDSIAFHTHVTLVDFVKQGPATKLVASGVCVCLTLSL